MTDGAPKKPTLFFAHPAGTYGTQAERVALRYLGKLHPNHRIINPGSPDYKGSEKSSNLIAKASDMLIYLPLADGTLTPDVAEAIAAALKRKNPDVHEMHVREDGVPSAMVSSVTRLDATRVLLPEQSTQPPALSR